MTVLIYIIKSVLISGLLFGYYFLFLRNRLFHRFNRIFLLSIPLISLLLPAMHFNMPEFWARSATAAPFRLLGVGRGELEEAVTIYANRKSGFILSRTFLAGSGCLLISLFLLIRFFKTIRFLQQLPKGKTFLQLPDATLYFVSEKGTPFSFFKSIFWGKEMELNNREGTQILRHELFHVKNNHSLDILLLEITSIIFWFNPFIHFIRRELRAIHEYAADAYAALESDEYEYASLLLFATSGKPLPLTHPFFKNLIKRRIAMITKSKKNQNTWLGRFMILPLIALCICLFSFNIENTRHLLPSKSIRVVIDAGHGGTDPGVSMNGIIEKNINLLIAKKIQELAASYSIEVIMTRDQDKLPGMEQNISGSLKYRTDLAGKEKADLFISIHTNRSDDQAFAGKNSGFDIYVSGKNKPMYDNSVKLGSLIAENIKQDFTMAAELKQQNSGVMVLDKATVPAILIECGYIDNASDLAYMTQEKHQEKIARDILEGVHQYALHPTAELISPETGMDTMSYEALEKTDPSTIANIDINAKENYVIVHFKNGKNAFVSVPASVKETWEKDQKNNQQTPVFSKVEVEAEYPGGQTAWYQYLAKNLQYPKDAVTKEIQGTVEVEFIVMTDGSVKEVHAKTGPDALRAESVKVLKASGKWTPAKNNGKLVNSYHIQPFIYKLQEAKAG